MAVREYPFYIKATVVLFGLILAVYVLYTLSGILIPIAFAIILTILLNPVCNWLLKRKLPKVVAIGLTLLLAIVVFLFVTVFLSSQIAKFGESWPVLKQKFTQLATQSGSWLQNQMGITAEKQADMAKSVANSAQAWAGSTVGSLATMLGNISLLPVYIFFLLFYKPLILNFLYEVFAEKNAKQVRDILNEVKSATQSYMVGLMLEALIVATLNSVALLILGVKYAILFGVIGALLNMIPYIGGIVAIALPVLMATATEDGYTTQLWIVVAYLIIQFIDNNVLVPRVVSSKVEINALISVVVVLLGGALWGVSGMFLSIPFTAILKIIFDRIPDLKPWGKLLGNDVPDHYGSERWGLRKRKTALSEKIVEDN
jgi:predicted PurR-regulated permease PerM